MATKTKTKPAGRSKAAPKSSPAPKSIRKPPAPPKAPGVASAPAGGPTDPQRRAILAAIAAFEQGKIDQAEACRRCQTLAATGARLLRAEEKVNDATGRLMDAYDLASRRMLAAGVPAVLVGGRVYLANGWGTIDLDRDGHPIGFGVPCPLGVPILAD